MSKKDPTGFFFESYEGMDTFAPSEGVLPSYSVASVRPYIYLNSTYSYLLPSIYYLCMEYG